MRTVITILLILVLAVATCVVTSVDSAVRVLGDADAVAAAVHRAGVRRALVDTTEEAVVRDLGGEARLGEAVRARLRAAIEGVLGDEWLDGVLRRCHRALAKGVAAAPATARLDLRPLKAELRRALGELRARAERACVEIAGADACSGDGSARRNVEADFQADLAAVAGLRDEIDIAAEVTRDPADQATVRRWLARAPRLRPAAMVALGVLLGLIVLVNIVPLRRLLASTGAALLLAATVALVVQGLGAARAREEVERAVSAAALPLDVDPALRRHVLPTLGPLAGAVIDDTAAAARGPLVAAAVAGAVLVAAGLALRSTRRV